MLLLHQAQQVQKKWSGRPCCTELLCLSDKAPQILVEQLNCPLQAPFHTLRPFKRFVRPLPALPACRQFRISQKLPSLRRVVQKSASVVIPCLANLMATLPASGQSDPGHIPFSTAVTIADIKDDVAVLRSLQHPKKVSCTLCSGLIFWRPRSLWHPQHYGVWCCHGARPCAGSSCTSACSYTSDRTLPAMVAAQANQQECAICNHVLHAPFKSVPALYS